MWKSHGIKKSTKSPLLPCPTTIRSVSCGFISNRLNEKVAVVTASTEGIGFAIAKRLAQEGAKVVVSSRKQSKVDKAVATLKQEGFNEISGIVCHVSNKDDRDRLLKHAISQFGGIDILVSNAGANTHTGKVLETSEAAWDKIMEINLKSSFQLTQEIVPLLKSRGGGCIVYVASMAGITPKPLVGAYSVSKAGLLAMAKVFATECAPMNIRVNCVAPGLINTKMGDLIKDFEIVQNYMKYMVDMIRNGEPHEVSAAVAFLCSEDATYITGEVICVSGGSQSRL